MRKRTTYTLLVVFLVLCALAGAVYLREEAPPEAARLLPEADAIVYINLKPLRTATHFDKSPVSPSPGYQQFIAATGIQPERDLNEAAFALTRMTNPNGPNGPVAFSEVFTGHFDSERLARYLAAQAHGTESYAGHTLYAIPSDGRTLLVTLIDYDTIAASNAPTPEQLHSIIDRARAGASPFSGSSLLSSRYAEVPAFSSAWAIGHLCLPFSENGHLTAAGLELPIPPDATLIASLRFTTALKLRIDDLTGSDARALETAGSLSSLLSLFRTLQQSQPVDPALAKFLGSVAIQAQKDRATLTATIPLEALKRLAP